MSRGEHVLPFGIYNGVRLDDIPISYLVWLAGRALRQRGSEYKVMEDEARFIYKNRHRAQACHCGGAIGPHDVVCEFAPLRMTTSETEDALLELVMGPDCPNSFYRGRSKLGGYWGRYPDEIKILKQYLKHDCNRCWDCDWPLQVIGHSRANGANHEDWEGRRLHKTTCWKARVEGGGGDSNGHINWATALVIPPGAAPRERGPRPERLDGDDVTPEQLRAGDAADAVIERRLAAREAVDSDDEDFVVDDDEDEEDDEDDDKGKESESLDREDSISLLDERDSSDSSE